MAHRVVEVTNWHALSGICTKAVCGVENQIGSNASRVGKLSGHIKGQVNFGRVQTRRVITIDFENNCP